MPRVVNIKFTQDFANQIVLKDAYDEENKLSPEPSATKGSMIARTITTVGGEGKLELSSARVVESYMIPYDFVVIDGISNSVYFPRLRAAVAQEDFDKSMNLLEKELPQLVGQLK
ncbi:hypothetical protein HA459_26075 (plasmid) [Rhizobium leguminosarum bv. trifolii]|uniref:hypothetical protein n=1 Tax=Rhizobium leguminosarum TaxID=384 RepID=UPI00140F7133|nr:hypothetical protein [Rhizobium leguminosarum]QIO75510.1 hypothetical protein HA459_26075 [Rhizobium leguminosarum bv. trifolii]QIO82524.1 hypothetical protein HA460_26115 [Rhizobium leguminosarum bv. trifolii]